MFLYTVLFGILFAASYDILRAVRRALPHALLVIQLEDILFWLGVGAASYWLMFSSNYGEIRGFCLLGLALGALLYGCTLGPFVLRGLSALLRALVNVLTLPWRALRRLFRRMKKIFRKRKKRIDDPRQKEYNKKISS